MKPLPCSALACTAAGRRKTATCCKPSRKRPTGSVKSSGCSMLLAHKVELRPAAAQAEYFARVCVARDATATTNCSPTSSSRARSGPRRRPTRISSASSDRRSRGTTRCPAGSPGTPSTTWTTLNSTSGVAFAKTSQPTRKPRPSASGLAIRPSRKKARATRSRCGNSPSSTLTGARCAWSAGPVASNCASRSGSPARPSRSPSANRPTSSTLPCWWKPTTTTRTRPMASPWASISA